MRSNASERHEIQEGEAVEEAYEDRVRLLYAVLADSLVICGTDHAAEAVSRFRVGLAAARQAKQLALTVLKGS